MYESLNETHTEIAITQKDIDKTILANINKKDLKESFIASDYPALKLVNAAHKELKSQMRRFCIKKISNVEKLQKEIVGFTHHRRCNAERSRYCTQQITCNKQV